MTNVGLGLLLGAVLAADTAVVAARPGGGNWPFELAVGVDRRRAGAAARPGPGAGGDGGPGGRPGGAMSWRTWRGCRPSPGSRPRSGCWCWARRRCGSPPPARRRSSPSPGPPCWWRGGPASATSTSCRWRSSACWPGAAALGVGVWLRFVDARHQLAVDAARRDERLELARELHDVVAHHVAGIVVQAQAARLVAARRPETLEPTLAGIESAGTDALGAMRRVVGLLRDAGDRRRAAASRTARKSWPAWSAGSPTHGPAVQLRLPDDGQASWPPEVASTVYRVVQEALTNVVLHAPEAAEVTVIVENGPSGVTVEVVDDGPAGPAAPSWFARGGGYGLVGMRERVEALGGTAARRAGPGGRLGGAGRGPGCGPGAPGEHPRPARRRPGHDPRRAAADPRGPARHHRGRRGRRRGRGDRAGPAAATRRLPGRHPDAGPGRHRGHPRAGRPGGARPAPGRDRHDLRPGRVRLRRAAGGRGRLPAQGHQPGAAGRGRPRRPGGRRPDLAAGHAPAAAAPHPRRDPAAQPAVPLSGRELEVAAAIARGRTNSEIAAELFISLSTVKSHLTSIHNKLDVRNRVEIAAWAWGNRPVQPAADCGARGRSGQPPSLWGVSRVRSRSRS